MENLTEKETREEIIDNTLRKVGWLKKYIKEEVNSVKSNFKTKDYILHSNSIEKGVDRYIDYLLLGEDSSPVAIIEAKKFSSDPKKGKIQSRTYQKDIEKQTGIRIPIFLTNGNEWFYIDQDGVERKVYKPFSQSTLQRRLQLYKDRRDLRLIKVNPKIVDRSRSISILSELKNHFEEKHRNALLLMATGTGKTRVAMGLIDILLNGNYVRNVLFIADRVSLANQAKENGFNKFFSESVSNIREDGFDTSKRLYVSTIQTLMSRKGKKFFFEQFDSGFFDLIIFDEAHRSIYDKNNLLMQYFDSIQVGLTATPKDSEKKNTFDLFGCINDEPTVEYSYDDAVRDGVLVTYKANIIETEVLNLGIEGNKLDERLKDELRRQEENEPDKINFTGKEFARVFMDDKTNEVIITEFMNRCYRSDDNKPCKSIFFCASQKHAKHIQKIFNRLYPNLGNDVQVITSDEYRAQDEIKRFKQDSEPRIALSVGMLDTGVDVPEIMNLVFVKPVFSPQRFWQMVGRGTRSLSACNYKDRLPLREKKDFLILDFAIGGHSNVDYHHLKRSSKDGPENMMKVMFENRIKLLNEKLSNEEKEIISKRILEDINSLGEESFKLQEKLDLIKELKANSENFNRYSTQLSEDISPLMILKQVGNPEVAAFTRDTEKLFKFILDKEFDKIEDIKMKILEKVEVLLTKTNLNVIKDKENLLISLFDESFWDDLTFKRVEFLLEEIGPLMEFYVRPPKKFYQVDKIDKVLEVREAIKELKEDGKLEQFLKNNSIAQKLKEGKGITSKIKISQKVILRDGISLIIAEFALIFVITGTSLNWTHGLILMCLYFVYVAFMLLSQGAGEVENDYEDEADGGNRAVALFKGDLSTVVLGDTKINKPKAIGLLIVSVLFIGLACFWLVEACEQFGTAIGMPIYFVSVVLASAATSVPDTIISYKDALKGNYDDAVANALGSNIFDVCFALGFPLFLFTLIYGPIEMSAETIDNIGQLRVLLLLLTVVIFFIFVFAKKGIKKFHARLLLFLYVLFVSYSIGKGIDYNIPIINEISNVLSNISYWFSSLV